jgi:hypothetical protein
MILSCLNEQIWFRMIFGRHYVIPVSCINYVSPKGSRLWEIYEILN